MVAACAAAPATDRLGSRAGPARGTLRLVEPITLRLHLGALARRDGVVHLLHARAGKVRAPLASAFAVSEDERAFARELLRRRPSLWLFRTHQRRFCGDFVALDMASPSPSRRRAWAIDLKQGGPLRIGGGGASVAFTRLHLAVEEIAAETHAIAAGAAVERVTGAAAVVLRHLGA